MYSSDYLCSLLLKITWHKPHSSTQVSSLSEKHPQPLARESVCPPLPCRNEWLLQQEGDAFFAAHKAAYRCIDRALSCSELNPVRTISGAKCRSLHPRYLQTPTGEADPHQSFEWKGCFMISSGKKQTRSKIQEHCGTSSASVSTQCNTWSQKKIAWYNPMTERPPPVPWGPRCLPVWEKILS